MKLPQRSIHKPPILLLLSAATGLGLSVLSSPYKGTAQEPVNVVESRISTEYRTPPATLKEMVLVADAVIIGRVLGGQPKDADDGKRIQTAVSVAVSEVLQNFGVPLGDQRKPIEVLRYGGDRLRGGKTIRAYESGFPQFKVGSEFVLFLSWNKHERLWEVMWGPAGMLEVAKGRARAWSKVGPLAQGDGRSATEVIESIKLMRSGLGVGK